MQYGQMPSDVNTDKITIKVKCTSCGAVEDTTICAESLDSDYTLNEDGTHTSIIGECADCLTGDDTVDESELPEEITDDPRLGKPATAKDGCTGTVDSISRFSDGYEVIHIYNEQTGIGCGGEASQFTISE